MQTDRPVWGIVARRLKTQTSAGGTRTLRFSTAWIRLTSLQTQLFSRRQQRDRFPNAFLPRFWSHGHMNPIHKITPVDARRLLKETPRFRIRFQFFGDMLREIRDCWSRRVWVVGWRR